MPMIRELFHPGDIFSFRFSDGDTLDWDILDVDEEEGIFLAVTRSCGVKSEFNYRGLKYIQKRELLEEEGLLGYAASDIKRWIDSKFHQDFVYRNGINKRVFVSKKNWEDTKEIKDTEIVPIRFKMKYSNSLYYFSNEYGNKLEQHEMERHGIDCMYSLLSREMYFKYQHEMKLDEDHVPFWIGDTFIKKPYVIENRLPKITDYVEYADVRVVGCFRYVGEN